MLLLNAIFERTWGGRAGPRPATEYWVDVISAIKSRHPGFLFIAEAYWDLEWELQQQGFDFCYDKKLYDRLEHSNADEHPPSSLCRSCVPGKAASLHREPRRAAGCGDIFPAKQRAAALTTATLPGIKLFHEGQFEGRKVRLPCFWAGVRMSLSTRICARFYGKLLEAINRPVFREGQWSLCERTGWPDNASFQNLVAWSWVNDDERYLIVVNLSDCPVQAQVQVRWSRCRWRKVAFD